jgi:putative peptidoglycan lipid II flippase
VTQDIKTLMIIALPAILTGGVSQINLLVGRNVASVNEGAIAWLSYADRLYQLPLGVIGIAMGVVLLPELSRRLKDKDTDGAQAAFSRAAEISLALTLPATAAFIAVPGALVSVLFERGQFTGADTTATALALMIYAIGLPAFVLQKVLQPLYYARSDTRRPFRFAIWTMVINLVLAIGLQPLIGWIAAPIATTVAAWGNVLMLYLGAARMGQAARLDTRFFKRLGPIVLSSALMGLGVWAAGIALEEWLNTATLRYLALLILITLGGLLYFPLAHITGGLRMRDIRKTVKR